jgi:hypothetical protein
MKRFLGWFFLICGLLSLPLNILKLENANETYEISGILLGSGLIFYIAARCLRRDHTALAKIVYSKDEDSEIAQDTRGNYPSIANKINKLRWEDILSLIFEYQKIEIAAKTYPKNYMDPYEHDKLDISNQIQLELSKSYVLEDLRHVRKLAKKLDIYVDTNQISDYLKLICYPLDFIGKDYFQEANDLYQEIIISSNDYDKLEMLLYKAQPIFNKRCEDKQ